MFSRLTLGDNACRWSNHGKSYEHSTGPKPPVPHVGGGVKPRPDLRNEIIIRRHGSPRFLKLNNFRTLLMLFSRSPIKGLGTDSQRMGTRVRARVPLRCSVSTETTRLREYVERGPIGVHTGYGGHSFMKRYEALRRGDPFKDPTG